MGLLRVVERLVHRREHVLLGRNCTLLVRPGLQSRARQQIAGMAEVCNELADGGTSGSPRVNNGIVQRSRSDAAIVPRIDRRYIGIGLWPEVRPHFAYHLLRRERVQASHRNRRIVLQRRRLRILDPKTNHDRRRWLIRLAQSGLLTRRRGDGRRSGWILNNWS